MQFIGTTGHYYWICICITDEKVQMQTWIQDHWAYREWDFWRITIGDLTLNTINGVLEVNICSKTTCMMVANGVCGVLAY